MQYDAVPVPRIGIKTQDDRHFPGFNWAVETFNLQVERTNTWVNLLPKATHFAFELLFPGEQVVISAVVVVLADGAKLRVIDVQPEFVIHRQFWFPLTKHDLFWLSEPQPVEHVAVPDNIV